MSDNIPFDIQAEIIKRIPDVKSLIRFRSVSKPWNSLISSSQFIADYKSKHHHLLITYFGLEDNEQKHVSIADDDGFPQHKFPLTHVPVSVKQLKLSTIVGSSQGLFMFFDITCNTTGPSDSTTVMAVVWNPSIRKSVSIDVPHVMEEEELFISTVVGFGVCPHTNDLMLVKITFTCDLDNPITSVPWQVEVFTLSSGVWRKPLCINSLPRNINDITMNQVVIDGCIYWKAYDNFVENDEFMTHHMLLSFDMTTEEFTEIYLPEENYFDLFISKLRESLVLFDHYSVAKKQEYRVWMMEGSVTKSFTKLYTISTPKMSIQRVLGFRKSGEPIIVIQKDVEQEAIFVYESDSQRIYDIGIYGKTRTCLARSYTESLLLLDQ